jgi:hypothetical protein
MAVLGIRRFAVTGPALYGQVIRLQICQVFEYTGMDR